MSRVDIRDRSDIEGLVYAFYRTAFADPLLGPIFVDVARLDLDSHMPVITDFWETMILRTGSYKGNAFEVHGRLNEMVPLGVAEFSTWLKIWDTTVRSRFEGPNADTAIRSAHRIAQAFQRRLNGSGDGSVVAFISDGSSFGKTRSTEA